MKTVWDVLSVLGFLSAAAFLVCLILVWMKLPVEPGATISAGTTALVMGLFGLREVFSTNWPRGHWGRRSDVPVGRLAPFAGGLGFCVGGVAILGHRWMGDHPVAVLLFLVAFLGSIVLAGVAERIDAHRYEASRTAIRRRGWLLAFRRADGDLPAGEVRWRQEARAILLRVIQRRLTGRTTWEQVEAQCRYLTAPAHDLAAPTDWPEVADEWRAFRSAATESDAIWGFNTVSARDGRNWGEEGFALLRDGTVVDSFITAVVG
jgi:hypothetical protein